MTSFRSRIALLSCVVAMAATLGAQNADVPASVTPAQLKAKLDAFIPSAMAQLHVVPGLSVAVVRGDDTIYTGGFGVADVARGTRVRPDTVFYTASLAKAVTGMTAATLVTDGHLALDAPLSTWFPGFRPPAGADPAKATLGGLLGHDPGFGNPTINYTTAYVRSYDLPELVRLLNTYSQPLPSFQYANTNYVLTAEIIQAVTGRSWKDVIADRVFKPLGMTHSTFYMSGAAGSASAYRADADGFTLVHLPKTDRTINGAGGFFSTAPELAQLVKAYLNHGRVGGKQLLPEAAVALAETPRSATSSTFTYFTRTGYGIGLYFGAYDGEPLTHHFGGITGFRAHMSFMPRRGIGVVVLQNEGDNGSRFADLVAAYAYDVLLGKDADALAAKRIAEYRANLDAARAKPDPSIAELAKFRKTPAAMDLPLAAYAGTYRSDRLGALTVSVERDELRVAFGDLHGVAVRIGGAKVLVDYGGGDPPDAWTFTVTDGKVTGIDWGGRIFTR